MLVFFLTCYLALTQYDKSINLLHVAGVHNLYTTTFAWIIRSERRSRTHLRPLFSYVLTLFFRMRKRRRIKQGGRGTLESKSQKKKRRRKGFIFMGAYVLWFGHNICGRKVYMCTSKTLS